MNHWFHTIGRAFQVVGLLITFNVVLLFFIPSFKMGPLLGLSLLGVLTFYVGYFMVGSTRRG
ncbi:MAG: hypothetical protein HZA19_02650 [Nitrospirae bacterium]|nr:hypothetical protein [Nitrospirota bacterium]